MNNSTAHKLHLVAFNIPYPADNGGLIDVLCKIKALKRAGVGIVLHCYEYGRTPAPELEQWCEAVHYYKRHTGKAALFGSLPYIVASRKSDTLVKRLAADEHPILLEGLHCCAVLDEPALKHKPIFVRSHNIEHDYYRGLAKVERNLFKRYYFGSEAGKLEQFEARVSLAKGIFAISKADTLHFEKKYPQVPAWNVPAFHLNDTVDIQPGSGEYALYHGSLDVGENNFAAIKLVKEVFNDLPYTLIIAGKNPSKELRQACEGKSHVILKSKVDTAQIQNLVRDAHINILPTWQSTGIKLKLLMALYCGRHCLVNDMMVKDTGLEPLCHIENTSWGMKKTLHELFARPFTQNEILHRRQVLEQSFSNTRGAETIKREIFGAE